MSPKNKTKYKILHIPTGLYLTDYWFGFQLAKDGIASYDKSHMEDMIKMASLNRVGLDTTLVQMEKSEFLIIEIDDSVDTFIKRELYPGG